MNKLPLTTEGVQQLTSELYALPQLELQMEANAVGVDFPSWVQSHFELSETQIQYLAQIDETWLENAASETKHALENRLPITLYKEVAKSSGEEGEDRGKLLDLDKNKKNSYSEESGFIESETLIYTISYQNG